MDHFQDIPAVVLYTFIATSGGIARFLTQYIDGTRTFSVGMLIASSFVSGFSGYMFALLGETMHLQRDLIFMMSGVGGYFGDQSLKLLLDILIRKLEK